MKIKTSSAVFFLLLWGVSVFSTLLYYFNYGVAVIDIVYAIVLAFFSSITTMLVFEDIEKSVSKCGHTCAFALLIVVVLYNQNSFTKYSVESLFDGYISNRTFRLFGSIYVDLVIILGTKLLIYYRRIRKIDFIQKKIPYISGWIIYLTVYIYILVGLLKLKKYYSSTRTMSTIYDALYYFTCILTVLYIGRGKKNILHWIPLTVLCCFQGYISIITGSKSATIKYLTIIGVCMYFTDLIKFKYIKVATVISPVFLQIFTIITEKTSNRMNMFYSEWVRRYHAFRYDLSDFAITVASKSDRTYAVGLIKDAILFAIPKYDVNRKSDILAEGTYRVQMDTIGLGKFDAYGYLEDFNDTLFSIGAELFGYIGIVLFFFFTLFGIEFLSKKISNVKNGYIIGLIAIGPIISIAECDLFRYVYTIRDMIFIFVLVYLVLLLVVKRKKHFISE